MKKVNLKKKTSALVICAVVLLCSLMFQTTLAVKDAADITAQLHPSVTITVDGTDKTFYNAAGQETHPILYNSTYYLPIRAIGELMGRNVNWDQSTLTVTLSSPRTSDTVTGKPDTEAKDTEISAQLRPDFTVIVDGVKRTFTDANGQTVYPLLYNGSVYLPLRAIGNLSGYAVSWEAKTDTISLTTSSDSSLVTDADSFGTTSSKPSTAYIGETKAKDIALADAGLDESQVTFVRVKLDYDDGRAEYEIEFYKDHTEYDYEIDAISGKIISYDYDAEYYTPSTSASTSSSYIGEEKAKSIALAEVPGANADHIYKLHLDIDDGRAEYDVKIYYNNMEYEFEIDASTGKILSKDIESRYDD